jgi:hypothetical protein
LRRSRTTFKFQEISGTFELYHVLLALRLVKFDRTGFDRGAGTAVTMWRLFRIFYTGLFTLLSALLLILTLLSPGDIIYQSYQTDRLGNIFATTGVYVITLLLAVLIYASRIFTNRSVLGGIPKPWIPVEKPDVPKSVRRLVVDGLARSAVIAYQARPRDRTGEDNSGIDPGLTIPPDTAPPWGDISHPGWTAPECLDLPSQEFDTVINELPHLLEAKAVSLAPPDPVQMAFGDQGRPGTVGNIPDERVVEILQRPRSMCLRGYLNHLARLNMIHNPDIATSFIRLFEQARYSEQPLTESEFRSMMGMFAELLRGMKALDPELVADIRAEASSFAEMDLTDADSASSFARDTASLGSDAGSFSPSQTGTTRRRNLYHPLSASASDSNSSFRVKDIGDRQSMRSFSTRRTGQTASLRSLRPTASNLSRMSGQSGIQRTLTDHSR